MIDWQEIRTASSCIPSICGTSRKWIWSRGGSCSQPYCVMRQARKYRNWTPRQIWHSVLSKIEWSDSAAYMEKCEKRREAGKLGGRPKANGSSEKQVKAKKANGFSEKQNNPDTDIDNEPDTDISSNDNRVIAPADNPPCAGKFLLNDATEYEVSENDVVTYQQLYPGIDVKQELRNIEAWCLSNPRNRKTRNGAKRFLNAWLSRAQNSARPERSRSQHTSQNKFNNFTSALMF